VVDTLVAEHDMLVVGVTGSAGKTSTKDIMASIFSAAGETIAPPGSFNNEIGHPYTALKCDETTQFVIAEMSARGLGHVAHLARIAPPRIGVVLNVGSAHIGEFGSREVIAQAKGELVEALPSADNGGVAVLNLDDDAVAGMAPRTSARILYFSAAGDERAQVRATNVSLDAQARPQFTLHVEGQDQRQVTLGIYGLHQVDNALAAIAAGVGAGLDLDLIVAAVQGHTNVSAHRMDVQSRADGATIINDAYNANPESMRAGLNALVATATGRDGARSFAVLGPMGELGDDGVAQHEKLAQVIAELGVNRLVAVGDNEYSKALASAATKLGTETSLAKDNDTAASIVAGELKEADVVLVKASNSFRLWEVAEKLLT
jgi:UDP-N-acetylmuramoyl-tripeptide--D-alanyl-D-alanine ligase